MSWYKKILFYLVLIMTFAVSFSSEDAKIYIDRESKPAKLKIGVTKLKTKELEMDFSAEKKIIYAELPESITDNHIIFISETLDEMPSLSTTNGRRSINNIKKYLTKDIKVAPKFQYKVVVGDKENGIEEGKRYLVINCKTTLSSVYVYVVEKGTYYVKEVYKGKFNISSTLEEKIAYGTIHFNGNHQLGSGGVLTYENGVIKLDGVDISTGENATVKLEGGEFPKRLNISKEEADRYYEKIGVGTGKTYPKVWIDFGEGRKGPYDFKPHTGEISVPEFSIKDINNNLAGKFKLISNKNQDFIQIQFINWNKFAEISKNIKIEYGRYQDNLIGSHEDVLQTDTFTLKIDKKPGIAFIGTEGNIAFSELHNLNKGSNQTITWVGDNNGNGEVKLNGATKDFIYFQGKYPKKFTENGEGIDWYQESIVRIKTSKGNYEVPFVKGSGEFTSDVRLQGYLIEDGDGSRKGELPPTDFIREPIEAKLKIFALANNEGENGYLKIQFIDWNPFTYVNENIEIEYIAREKTSSGNIDHILRKDILRFNTSARKENIPDDTRGTLVIYDTSRTAGMALGTDKNGNVSVFNTSFNFENQAYIDGNFPLKFSTNERGNSNTNIVNWNNKGRIEIWDEKDNRRIDGYSFGNDSGNSNIDFKWIGLSNFSGGSDDVGNIHLYLDKNQESFQIGFGKTKWGNEEEEDLDISGGKTANISIGFRYYSYIDNKPILKKHDILNLIIGGKFKPQNAKIKVNNPIVMYDYHSMNPFNHNKRIQLSSNEARTLDVDGRDFLKNTTSLGKQWITSSDVSGVRDYDWKKYGKHPIGITSSREGDNEYGEILKGTDEKGRTQSSTFVDLGGKNQVMFSYDGGNKYINFGVSKYNFKGGSGEVIITHYGGKGGETNIPQEVTRYVIDIPKFDGLPYVSNQYDIKPFYDNVKYYKFDQEIGANKIIIPYGTVGFKDLDTRITEQSGGEGIELRIIRDVVLESMFYDTSSGEPYRIDAELYFRREGSKVFDDTLSDGTRVSRFKGENEKSTSAMVYLVIDNQESLIPGGEYKIVKKVKNTTKIISDDTPIEVGVIVDRDDKTYFKGVGDLYLSLEDRRFVDTKVTFDNEKINFQTGNVTGISSTDDSVWIRLNKTDYPTGVIIKDYVGEKWGSISEEVVDIPLKYQNGREIKTKIQVLDENYQEISGNFNSSEGATITLGKNILYLKYKTGDSYISFKLNPTTNDENVPSYKVQPEEKIFYIRYYDDNRKNESGEIAPNAYLFTQRVRVVFDEPRILTGDTRVNILNPTMIVNNVTQNEGILFINDTAEYKDGKVEYDKDNSKLDDAEKWWEVFGATNYDSIENYPYFKLTQGGNEISPQGNIYTLKNGMKLYLDEKSFESAKRLTIGVKDIQNYNGQKIDEEFYLEWRANPSTGIITGKGRRDKVTLSVDTLDTTYYGLITDVKNSSGTSYKKINKVGIGENHQLRILNESEEYVDIELNSYFREYTRNRGILDLIDGAGNLYLKVDGKNESGANINSNIVSIIPRISEDSSVSLLKDSIEGEIIFKNIETNTEAKSIEIENKINLNEIKMYKIVLRLKREEYKKLQGNTWYEIFGNKGKDIFIIDFSNEKLLDSSVNKRLRLSEALNFSTSDDYFWIEEAILDFGEVSLNGTPKEVSASTELRVHSKYSNYKLQVDNQMKITKINSEGEYDENHKLIVKDIVLDLPEAEKRKIRAEEGDKDERLSTHTLSGKLEVPNKDVELGEYKGYLMVDVTIIN